MSILDGKMRLKASPGGVNNPSIAQTVFNPPTDNQVFNPPTDQTVFNPPPNAPDYNQMYQASQYRMAEMSATASAVPGVARCNMYLIKPRVEPNYTVRPYEFNFGPDVTMDVLQHIGQRGTRPGLLDVSKLSAAITPTMTNSYSAATGTLSDKWRFVMLVDQVEKLGINNLVHNAPLMRTVVTGYALDEPINPATNTPNPHAQFYITAISNYKVNTSRGHCTQSSNNNHEIAPRGFYGSTTDNMLFKATPGNYGHGVRRAMSEVTNPLSKVSIVGDQSITGSSDVRTKTEFRSAKQTANALMTGLTDTINGVMVTGNASEVLGIEDGSAVNSFNNHLHACDRIGIVGIAENAVTNFGRLEHMYGHVNVVPMNSPDRYNVDLYPTEQNNIKNVFQSMIADTIHFLCTDLGINTLSFAYASQPDTPIGGAIYQLDKQPMWTIMPGSFETNHPLPDRTLTAMFETIKRYLETQVFNTIRDTMGDEFTIIVDYAKLDATKVSLNFHNDLRFNDHSSYYIQPIHFGGIATPNLAKSQTYVNNDEQIRSLLDSCIDQATAFI